MEGIIYKISNSVNDKVYIGRTTQGLVVRFGRHKYDSTRGSTCVIHRAMRKHGVNNFVCEQIDSADGSDKLNELEIHHIKEHDSFNNGYNSTVGGAFGGRISQNKFPRKELTLSDLTTEYMKAFGERGKLNKHA